MSQPKKSSTYGFNDRIRQAVKTKEPLIVRYNLHSKHDIKTAVEALLLNKELSNSSSIFVIVPASDDEDDENLLDSFNSTIGIQLSENTWRKKNYDNSESDACLTRPMPCILKPSNRASKMFEQVLNAIDQYNSSPTKDISNKLCQITTPHEVTNKLCQMTTPCDVTNKICQVTSPDGDIKRPYYTKIANEGRHTNSRDIKVSTNKMSKKFINKLCQATIPGAVIYRESYVAGTDTTTDRPCCCKLQTIENGTNEKPCCCIDTYFTESIEKCTKRVLTTGSHLISPVLVKTEFSTEDFNVSNQSSFLQPLPFSTLSASLISPDTQGYETDPIFEIDRRCIYNTPVPEFEQDQKLTMQSCLCTPEKLRQLLEQVLAEKTLNKMSVCCGSPMETPKVFKRTRFLDDKCSQTMNETGSNKCGPNASTNCGCEKLLDFNGQTLQNIGASTLFCLDDTVNIASQRATLPKRSILMGQSKPCDSLGQLKEINEQNYRPAVKARCTYTQAGKERRYSTVAATEAHHKYVVKDMAKRKDSSESLPLNLLDKNENISTNTENKEQIKSNLIRTMSRFKYPLNQASSKPKLNVGTNIVKEHMNSECPSFRPITHYDDFSICSKPNGQIKSNLIRTSSGYKYPQKQPTFHQKEKPLMTFEEFLKYCAETKKNLVHELPPFGFNKPNNIKIPSNFYEPQKINKTTPIPPLQELFEKSKDWNVKVEPLQGLKLSMSGKGSYTKELNHNSNQQLLNDIHYNINKHCK